MRQHLQRDQLTGDELMAERLDLTGQRFGRLEVIGDASDHVTTGGNAFRCVSCKCLCGETIVVRLARLRSGHTASCGCIQRDLLLKRNTSHGKSRTPEYKVWQAMKARCTNPADKEWSNYGGRGIKVCDRWLKSFQVFYDDMGPRPSTDLTIERYDVNGNYCPENCGWEPQSVQACNRRNNKLIEYQGRQMTQAEASRLSGVHLMTLRNRIARGLTGADLFEPAFSVPRVSNPYGKSFAALDREWGFKRGTVADRMRRGWAPEDWSLPPLDPVETGKRAMQARWGNGTASSST